jgi:hypothetical protein
MENRVAFKAERASEFCNNDVVDYTGSSSETHVQRNHRAQNLLTKSSEVRKLLKAHTSTLVKALKSVSTSRLKVTSEGKQTMRRVARDEACRESLSLLSLMGVASVPKGR